ncbi:type 1 glutamine amidotransferase domain-containing protein [Bradyrhizobium tropiciagri]|uniref:type 1 glutamine amidotransferase domain-containing protein n=1 Tax=Bradyrhizobium tropiciagri TaxID=312253 RepID=UPI000A4B945A|nr:type 1 glutamine amidotransferase domain-containing protein [Bradyrhizobium tropiciagri]
MPNSSHRSKAGEHRAAAETQGKLPSVRAALLAIASLALPHASTLAAAADGGKVLVILSSANQLQLRDGKQYRTGFYLDELSLPLRKIIDAGFTPVFANPKGNAVDFDPVSNDKMFFGGSEQVRDENVKFVENIRELQHPRTLAEIAKEGTSGYVGIFIPGGHAPMEDLSHDKVLGGILASFHAAGRPTGVICHGPTALLSAVSDPEAFRKAIIANDFTATQKIAANWPYAGYRLTVFSSGEEHAIEGDGRQLGGSVLFYAADALAQAGAHVDRLAAWNVNVLEDRELVSGQQPFSSEAFGDVFVAKLKSSKSL